MTTGATVDKLRAALGGKPILEGAVHRGRHQQNALLASQDTVRPHT